MKHLVLVDGRLRDVTSEEFRNSKLAKFLYEFAKREPVLIAVDVRESFINLFAVVADRLGEAPTSAKRI